MDLRRLLPILSALVLAAPAFGQSSLGGAQNVPPPRQAAPAPAPAAQPRPEQRPPVVNPPARPQATQRNAEGQPRPAAQQQQRPPGQQQQQQRPAGQPQAGQGNRAAAGAAAGVAAGAAAGAAATAGAAKPPEAATAPAPPPERAPTIGSISGLPLPRFAALRSDEVNMRSGPGTRFPIEWTYQRRELPVEIVREFELWRRIRDPEGTEGWVHQSTLMGRRSFIVRGAPGSEVMLRRRAEDQAQPVARLRPGVVGRLRACEPSSAWCEAQIGEFRGHIRRADIWGVGPNEEVK
ncbi:MAG: SH3 domain-containing protein [Alphaproteobacteria bacterium]